MTKPIMPAYILHDPRINAAQGPYTFHHPSEAQQAAVSAGDQVQLILEHVPAGRKWSVERLWVAVTDAEGQHLRGTLLNKPAEPDASIHLGDCIAFERHYIISIIWANVENAPPSEPRRQYWDRCLVDDCILDGSDPVEFIYREEPGMTGGGDEYPDSGWRIRGRMGSATDEQIAARKISYVALGAVLNRDDSWLHLIDKPIGSSYLRDFERDEYVPEG